MKSIQKMSPAPSLVRCLAAVGLTAITVLSSAQANSNNSTSTATRLSLNTLTGNFSIGARGENDYYYVTIPSYGSLTVQSEGSTDTFGYLLNPSKTTIVSHDDISGGFNNNFRMNANVVPGKHWVRVRHYSPTGTGSYKLRTSFTPSPSDDHGNNVATATSIFEGYHPSPVAGNIERGGDVDWFKIYVDRAYISAGCPFVRLSAISRGATDVKGYLYDSSGQELLSYSDDSHGGVNFSTGFDLPDGLTSGVFYLKVEHFNPTASGAYELLITRGTDDHRGSMFETTTVLSMDSQSAVINGQLQGPGDIDTFRVDVKRSGSLTVISGGSYDLVGRIYNSAGVELMMNNDRIPGDVNDLNFAMEVPVTVGSYFVEVQNVQAEQAGDGGYAVGFIQP